MELHIIASHAMLGVIRPVVELQSASNAMLGSIRKLLELQSASNAMLGGIRPVGELHGAPNAMPESIRSVELQSAPNAMLGRIRTVELLGASIALPIHFPNQDGQRASTAPKERRPRGTMDRLAANRLTSLRMVGSLPSYSCVHLLLLPPASRCTCCADDSSKKRMSWDLQHLLRRRWVVANQLKRFDTLFRFESTTYGRNHSVLPL